MFLGFAGYSKGTSRLKFSEVVEKMLDKHITKNLTVCCMPVSLGRKELEEKIQAKYKPEFNRKGLGKSS